MKAFIIFSLMYSVVGLIIYVSIVRSEEHILAVRDHVLCKGHPLGARTKEYLLGGRATSQQRAQLPSNVVESRSCRLGANTPRR